MIASFDIPNVTVSHYLNDEPSTHAIAVGHSNSQDFGLTFYGGLRLTKEDCGIPLTKIRLGKHTSGLKLHDRINKAIHAWKRSTKSYHSTILSLQNWPLLSDEVTEYLTCAGRLGIMPWSRLGQVDQLYKKMPKTAWFFVKAFATVAKQNPPLKQLDQIHRCIHSVILTTGVKKYA